MRPAPLVRLCCCVWLLLHASACLAQNPVPPIGQWRDHLNYQQATQVVRGSDKVFCATASSLFSVDNTDEITRYSKVTGLNDINVQCIAWDAATSQLVTVYANSNVDVLKAGTVHNIGDIRRSSVTGNKTVYAAYCSNGFAYLCSGLGIIVANLSRYEISDTWTIGNNGAQVKVNGFTSDGTSYYAATDEGLKSIAVNSPNPSDYSNWQMRNGANGLTPGAVNDVVVCSGKVVARKGDSLFLLNGATWSLLYTDPSWPLINSPVSENRILLCQRGAAGNARVAVLNVSGQVEKVVAQANVVSYPSYALSDNGSVWVADRFGGLSRFGAVTDRFIPNGPPGAADGSMAVRNGLLAVAAGSVNTSWNYQYNRNGVYFFRDDSWTYKGYYNIPVLDSVLDLITLAIDPRDASVWAGSYGGGLVHFRNDQSTSLYKKSNSTLQAATGDPGSFRVSGLAFDQNNNLWISNYGAPQDLQVRKADSSFLALTIPFQHLENAVGQIVLDDLNQLWIQSPKGNGLFCFNYGQSVDNTSDDKWKQYRQGSGNGNLPSNNVLCLLKDNDGFIWVGTDQGIGIIQCPANVFDIKGCDAILPVVQFDRFAGLLFKSETVQCMAVDGANRKWIGTKNGVWLISADGSNIIYRFTEDNSPLFSNDVKQIAIDPASGEVFISTIYGICSFRSTATEGAATDKQALVFPNPVPPGYNGTIAIKGLTNNALVKITELSGRLVYQLRALGGQATWNGRNYRGDKVASGVYLVIVRNDDGTETTVSKIVITSGR